MANDRMFIINTKTGHRFYIAKRYCDGWYTTHEGQLAEHLQEYMDTSPADEQYDPHAWTIGYEETDEEFNRLPFILFKPSIDKK